MVDITQDDVTEVRAIHAVAGREPDLAQLLYRFPWMTAECAPATLRWVIEWAYLIDVQRAAPTATPWWRLIPRPLWSLPPLTWRQSLSDPSSNSCNRVVLGT